jgi:hypothetical protein
VAATSPPIAKQVHIDAMPAERGVESIRRIHATAANSISTPGTEEHPGRWVIRHCGATATLIWTRRPEGSGPKSRPPGLWPRAVWLAVATKHSIHIFVDAGPTQHRVETFRHVHTPTTNCMSAHGRTEVRRVRIRGQCTASTTRIVSRQFLARTPGGDRLQGCRAGCLALGVARTTRRCVPRARGDDLLKEPERPGTGTSNS